MKENFCKGCIVKCPFYGKVNACTGKKTSRSNSTLKYKNKKVEHEGKVFDSKKEFKRYLILRSLEKAGKIYDLELQPKFELQPAYTDIDNKKHRAMHYVADFKYKKNGCERAIVEDVKSSITAKKQSYRDKIKMLKRRYHDIKFIEVLDITKEY